MVRGATERSKDAAKSRREKVVFIFTNDSVSFFMNN